MNKEFEQMQKNRGFKEELVNLMLEHKQLCSKYGTYTNPHLVGAIIDGLHKTGYNEDTLDELWDWCSDCFEL